MNSKNLFCIAAIFCIWVMNMPAIRSRDAPGGSRCGLSWIVPVGSGRGIEIEGCPSKKDLRPPRQPNVWLKPITDDISIGATTGLACIEKTLAKNAGCSLARSIGSVGRVSIHSSGGSKSDRFKCFR